MGEANLSKTFVYLFGFILLCKIPSQQISRFTFIEAKARKISILMPQKNLLKTLISSHKFMQKFFAGICPLLCSGHGVYGGGQCHCVDGWKGPECEVRSTECVIADCSRHGQCREGVCICNPGWTGEHCQTRKHFFVDKTI